MKSKRIVLGVFLAAGLSIAQQQDPERPGGWLENRGVSVGVSYVAESFTSVQGGLEDKSGRFLGSFVPKLNLDLAKLGLGRGHVYVSGQVVHGRGINDSSVGAIQTPSNLDAPGFRRFIEAWYEDSYLGDKLRVKAGRQYADADFGVVENGADFLNSSYGLNPTTPMPTYPHPDLGGSVWFAPVKWISWGAGVYRESEEVEKRPFVMVETKLTSGHGTYRVGMWRHNHSNVHNHGAYVAADHWFMRNSRGPGVFFQWGWTPARHNEVCGYTGGGVMYRGLIPHRRADKVGVGVASARVTGADRETVIEFFYKVAVTQKIAIQPDLQWFHKPSGRGPKALVAGLRMALDF